MKKINLKMILCGVAAVFGFIAAMMLFAPAITPKAGGESISGSEIAFGKEALMGMGMGVSAYMLPLFLALIGVVCVAVSAFGKGGKAVTIVAAVAFVGAAICYFLPFQMATVDFGEAGDLLTSDQKSEATKAFRDSLKEAGKLGAGAIVGGIFAIIAAVASVVPMFVCKENN